MPGNQCWSLFCSVYINIFIFSDTDGQFLPNLICSIDCIKGTEYVYFMTFSPHWFKKWLQNLQISYTLKKTLFTRTQTVSWWRDKCYFPSFTCCNCLINKMVSPLIPICRLKVSDQSDFKLCQMLKLMYIQRQCRTQNCYFLLKVEKREVEMLSSLTYILRLDCRLKIWCRSLSLDKLPYTVWTGLCRFLGGAVTISKIEVIYYKVDL